MRSSHIPYQIYWRSDTRPPVEIFEKGFTPRETNVNDTWWKSIINYGTMQLNINSVESKLENCDANKDYGICMSTNFYSTTIFPVDFNEKETYIYAIVLPECLKLDNDLVLQKNMDLSYDTKNAVIDLHSFQVSLAAKERARIQAQLNNTYYACEAELNQNLGKLFYAYEAVALNVPPQNIIAAIRVARAVKLEKLPLSHDLPTATFQFNGNYIENYNYAVVNPSDNSTTLNKSTLLDLEYKAAKISALKFFEQGTNKVMSSPIPRHGLGGKTFASFNIDKVPAVKLLKNYGFTNDSRLEDKKDEKKITNLQNSCR